MLCMCDSPVKLLLLASGLVLLEIPCMSLLVSTYVHGESLTVTLIQDSALLSVP